LPNIKGFVLTLRQNRKIFKNPPPWKIKFVAGDDGCKGFHGWEGGGQKKGEGPVEEPLTFRRWVK
jgi:hypothetical protein